MDGIKPVTLAQKIAYQRCHGLYIGTVTVGDSLSDVVQRGSAVRARVVRIDSVEKQFGHGGESSCASGDRCGVVTALFSDDCSISRSVVASFSPPGKFLLNGAIELDLLPNSVLLFCLPWHGTDDNLLLAGGQVPVKVLFVALGID
jgi:hypothetical protein